MKHILCVIDLTHSSQNVLEVAVGLANEQEAHLTILFPYRLIEYGYKGDVTKLKARLEHDAIDKFSILKNQISLLEKLSYEFQPEIGFTVDRINSYVKRNKVYKIVISQFQANGINEINTKALQYLITSSKIPFTIVPEILILDISK